MSSFTLPYGQALTEFLVSASFVLVPLFLIVPVVGKYIDLKQTTVVAARYGAWEYTVHAERASDYASGFRALPSRALPVKSHGRLNAETLRRFYSDSRLPLDTQGDSQLGYRAQDRNPLWTYHDGSPIVKPPTGAATGPLQTPDPARLTTGMLSAMAEVTGLWKRMLQAVGTDAGFDAIDTRGRFRMAVRVPVAEAPGYRVFNQASAGPLFLSPLGLHMQARAAVLTESWEAGGRDQATYQSRGLVPSALLRRPMRPLQHLANFLLTPELREDKLIWGQMQADQVPEEHLQGGKRLSCLGRDYSSTGGYCRYE